MRDLPVAVRCSVLFLVTLGSLWVAGCGDNDRSNNPHASPTRTAGATATTAPVVTPTEDVPSPTATHVPSSPTSAPEETMTPTVTTTPTPVPTQIVSNPLVEGPIVTPNVPFIQATNFDLADVGYQQAEYFVSGTAVSYANDGELGPDGVWKAVVADSAPFKTRILVYRPIAAERFNGSVIVEWLNVSGGLDAAPDWTAAHTELIREGYAWVGVSAQFVGVEGTGNSPIPGLGDLSLKHVRPGRYHSLSHPGDSFSYDMFSQAGQAVRHPMGIDPLGGLQAERVIAAGESQSAFRMVTYVNAIHPLVGLYDGFLIHSRGASSAALSQAPQLAITMPQIVHTRGDLRVPVITFQTETDLITLGYLSNRQPNGPLFRLWEVAGTAHADTYTLIVGFVDKGNDPAAFDVLSRSDPIPGIIECDSPINSGPQHVVLKAAFAALERWVRTGVAPTSSSPLLETAGDPAAYVVDELGNVKGGIRTPWVDVPIATHSGLGQTGSGFCRIFGTTELFDGPTLASLYPTHDAYVSAVNASTGAGVEAGFILPADAELIKAQATQSDIGN